MDDTSSLESAGRRFATRVFDFATWPWTSAMGLHLHNQRLRFGLVSLSFLFVFGSAVTLHGWYAVAVCVLGGIFLSLIGYERRRDDLRRNEILHGERDEAPDRVASLLEINLLSGSLIIPLFAILDENVFEITGGFATSHYTAISFLWFSTVQVLTVFTGGTLDILGITLTHIEPHTILAKLLVSVERAIAGFMLVSGIIELVTVRHRIATCEDGFAAAPDQLLRLGSRGLSGIKRRLASSVPNERPIASALGYLDENVASSFVLDTLRSAPPAASSVAAWMVRKVGIKASIPILAARLIAYDTFFAILRRDYLNEAEYARDIANAGARSLRVRSGGSYGSTAEYQSQPPSNHEVYQIEDINDVCEFLRALTKLCDDPEPREGGYVDLIHLIDCNSPAIRAEAARYFARFAVRDADFAPIAVVWLAPALDREVAKPAILAQIAALDAFRLKDESIAAPLRRHAGSANSEIKAAAARALIRLNSLDLIGDELLPQFIDSDDRLVSRGTLIIFAGCAERAGIETAFNNLDHQEDFFSETFVGYLARIPDASVAHGLLMHARTVRVDRCRHVLYSFNAGSSPAVRSKPVVDDLVWFFLQASDDMVREYAVYSLGKIGAHGVTSLLISKLGEEFARDPRGLVTYAIIYTLGRLEATEALPLLQDVKNELTESFDVPLYELLEKTISKLGKMQKKPEM